MKLNTIQYRKHERVVRNVQELSDSKLKILRTEWILRKAGSEVFKDYPLDLVDEVAGFIVRRECRRRGL